MTSRHRILPARPPRAAPVRVPLVRRSRAWGAALLGTLAGVACGLALFARAPVVDGGAPIRHAPPLTHDVPRRTLATAPVASVIEPAVGAGRAPSHDGEDGLP